MVSVWPLLPLLRRHTSVETPSEPDISTASLWKALVFCPIALTYAAACWNSTSESFTSRIKACRCRTSADITSRKRGSGACSISLSTALVTESGPSMIMLMSPGGHSARYIRRPN